MHSGGISATENAEVDDRLLMFCHIKYVGFINNNYAPTLNSETLRWQNYEILAFLPRIKRN